MALQFLKRNEEAHKAVAKADLVTEEKKSSTAYRFWIKRDAETQITFLDGDLADNGLIETVSYWEHNLRLNGSWNNFFVCTQDDEPCPICESVNGGSGDSPSLVTAFTIIDHTKWKDKKDVTHQHERKLFICKRETFKRLQKIATKRDGLAGVTFDVSRIGEKSPSVGSDFDFVEKRTLPQLGKAYGVKADVLQAFDYEAVLNYRDSAKLRELGFGSSGVIGSESSSPSSYEQDL